MLKKVFIKALILSLVAAIVALVFFETEYVVSLLAGAMIGFANVVGIFIISNQALMSKHKYLPLFFGLIKFPGIIFLIWLALFYFKLDVWCFVVGLTLPIIAAVYEGIRHMRRESKDA